MKKLFIRVALALLILLVVAVVGIALFMDGAVKRAVEKFGPPITKVDVRLDSVSLSLLSGSGKIKNFVLGNPSGYKSASAINIGVASVALKPASVLSDKIIITSVNIQAPEITLEGDLAGNNLSKILANLEESTSGGKDPTAQKDNGKPAKKLQVDDLVISGGRIHLQLNMLGGKSATVPLPEIHLSDLGKGSDGITAAELSKRVMREILQAATKAAAISLGELSKGALQNVTKEGAGKITKGLGDFLNKK